MVLMHSIDESKIWLCKTPIKRWMVHYIIVIIVPDISGQHFFGIYWEEITNVCGFPLSFAIFLQEYTVPWNSSNDWTLATSSAASGGHNGIPLLSIGCYHNIIFMYRDIHFFC